MITIENLSFKYKTGSVNALNNINLEIEKGDFVGIIGESGSGKTTLCNSINALIPHHFKGDFWGSVKIDGKDTFDVKPGVLALKVGSVFQDIDSQMVCSFVEDEIRFGLENFRFDKDKIEDSITEALRNVGMEDFRQREISSLSGGQKQKVAIAAILALKPEILVLDEPTGELDPSSSREIFLLLKRLNEEENMTIIIVEQKIMLLCEFVKNLIVLEKGSLVSKGAVREVLKDSKKLEEKGINCPRVVALYEELQEKHLLDGKNTELCINSKEAASVINAVIKG